MNTGQSQCITVVDVQNAGVGVRADEEFGVQHAAHFDVVDEGGIAFGELDGVDFLLRLADDAGFGNVGCDFRPNFGLRLRRRVTKLRRDVIRLIGVTKARIVINRCKDMLIGGISGCSPRSIAAATKIACTGLV